MVRGHHKGRGGTGAANFGFDVVLLAGQSNMAGRGIFDAATDTTDLSIFQFDGLASDSTYRTLIPAVDPLKHPETTLTAVGPGMFFAKGYLANTGRRVLLVPTSWGGTGLCGGIDPWNPNGTDTGAPPAATGQSVLYFNAINQVKRCQALGGQFIGTLWIQGEADGANSISQATYESTLTTLVAGIRSLIPGASKSWFIIGQMLPEAITTRTGYDAIDIGHQHFAGTSINTNFVIVGAGYNTSGDTLHYGDIGIHLMGTGMANAVSGAISRVASAIPGQVINLATQDVPDPSSIALTYNYPTTGGPTTDFVIQYTLSGQGSWTTFTHPVSDTRGIVVTGLASSTAYDLRVAAKNSNGTGVNSALITATTGAAETTSFVRFGTMTGKLNVESGSAGVGWSYTTASGVSAFTSDHAGTSDKKIASGTNGAFQTTIAATTDNWMLGIVLSNTDPDYSTGASGYKYAIFNSAVQYSLKSEGSATTIVPLNVIIPAAGDILRLRRTSGQWVAEVARSATPTAFNEVYSFPVTDTTDSWCAVAVTGSGAQITGPIVGNGVV